MRSEGVKVCFRRGSENTVVFIDVTTIKRVVNRLLGWDRMCHLRLEKSLWEKVDERRGPFNAYGMTGAT